MNRGGGSCLQLLCGCTSTLGTARRVPFAVRRILYSSSGAYYQRNEPRGKGWNVVKLKTCCGNRTYSTQLIDAGATGSARGHCMMDLTDLTSLNPLGMHRGKRSERFPHSHVHAADSLTVDLSQSLPAAFAAQREVDG